MKKLVSATLGVAVLLMTSPALAATSVSLDNYGCRWESSQNYHCYRGLFAGVRFNSQQEMFNQRVEPIYIDDSGAPRSMPPFPARGASERPPTDAGTWDDVINIY